MKNLPLLLLLLALTGCEQSREISYKTPLDRVPGASRSDASLAKQVQQTPVEAARAKREELSKKDERGREVLVLESPHQAIFNLGRLLNDPASDGMLLEQLISETTKKRMVADGGTPEDAVVFLRENTQDIQDLLRRMPFAEQSMDVSMEKQGGGVYCFRLRKGPARGLRYDSVWLALENGKWKWVWVTGP
ncbi:MAG: hypothetical protein ACK5UW_04705 [bacterium]